MGKKFHANTIKECAQGSQSSNNTKVDQLRQKLRAHIKKHRAGFKDRGLPLDVLLNLSLQGIPNGAYKLSLSIIKSLRRQHDEALMKEEKSTKSTAQEPTGRVARIMEGLCKIGSH